MRTGYLNGFEPGHLPTSRKGHQSRLPGLMIRASGVREPLMTDLLVVSDTAIGYDTVSSLFAMI